ncbi:MAG TPA: hypothetical protein VMX74_05080 [Pirellulales bacterium]|nr:hypothetical protein [Pirellulales bacterium]
MLQMKKSPMMTGRRDVFTVESDFEGFVTGDEFTSWDDTAAVIVVADAVGGQVLIPTTALDDDESGLHTTQECFLYQNLKPIVGEALFFYSEVTADTTSLFIGFMDASQTTPFVNVGLGPKASFNGFGIYRKGSTAGIAAGNLTALDAAVWWTIVDNLTDALYPQKHQRLDDSDRSPIGNLAPGKVDAEADTLYRFHMECNPVGLKSALVATFDFDFWINDIHVAHERADLTIANFANMQFCAAIHAGDAQIDSITLDYMSASQRRIDAV